MSGPADVGADLARLKHLLTYDSNTCSEEWLLVVTLISGTHQAIAAGHGGAEAAAELEAVMQMLRESTSNYTDPLFLSTYQRATRRGRNPMPSLT